MLIACCTDRRAVTCKLAANPNARQLRGRALRQHPSKQREGCQRNTLFFLLLLVLLRQSAAPAADQQVGTQRRGTTCLRALGAWSPVSCKTSPTAPGCQNCSVPMTGARVCHQTSGQALRPRVLRGRGALPSLQLHQPEWRRLP